MKINNKLSYIGSGNLILFSHSGGTTIKADMKRFLRKNMGKLFAVIPVRRILALRAAAVLIILIPKGNSRIPVAAGWSSRTSEWHGLNNE